MADVLPNAEQVLVEERRIREYLLNRAHPSGASKSAFFHAHGFAALEWQRLQASLMRHAVDNAVVRQVETSWGSRYTVRCRCKTPDGRDPCIRTIWQMEAGVPRLLTAIPDASGL
jgi:filamentous hemagglutinin